MQKQDQTNLINSYGLLDFNYMYYGLLEVLGQGQLQAQHIICVVKVQIQD